MVEPYSARAFRRGQAQRLRRPVLAAAALVLACAAAVAEPVAEIDIAVGYTEESLRAFDGKEQDLRAHVQTYRDRTNDMLEASGATVRLNIVAVEAVRPFRQTRFAADRRRFINGEDGGEVLEQVRDAAGADVRLLLVNYDGRGSRVHYGGIFDRRRTRSEALKNAYAMIGVNAGPMTFAHEMGHVLGCQHARPQPCLGARAGALPYAYGFRSPGGIGTIMAGTCATGKLLPLYSSPALSHRYKPPGEDREKTIRLGSETADCVRTINTNAPYLAALNARNAPAGKDPQAPQLARLLGGPVQADAGTVD